MSNDQSVTENAMTTGDQELHTISVSTDKTLVVTDSTSCCSEMHESPERWVGRPRSVRELYRPAVQDLSEQATRASVQPEGKIANTSLEPNLICNIELNALSEVFCYSWNICCFIIIMQDTKHVFETVAK